MSGVNKEISSTQRQLKDVERLLKMDPGNTELLRQKYELLNKSIESTEKKLDGLKEAEQQVQEQFARGDISEEQYNALKREIIETEAKLGQLRTEAQKTDSAIKGIDEKPVEEVEEAADDAKKALKNAGQEASNFGDYLKAGAIIEGAKGIASALKETAEETKEFQKIMASLEISSEKAGYSAQQTAESYRELYGYIADDQTTATTLANLQKLNLSQEELTRLMKGTIGAWAEYGDSIPIDGLAEAINETVKVGQVTGTFADVLNWAGTSEDAFNEKLEAAGSEAERVNLVMEELANQGLIDSAEAWKENNKALYESNVAAADLQQQMALLGELIQPILTEITEKVIQVLTWFNGLDSETQMFILTIIGLVAVMGPLISVFEKFSSLISFITAHPIVLLIAAIVALVALIAAKGDEIQQILKKVDDFLENVFEKDWREIFGSGLGTILNNFFANFKNIWESVKSISNGLINFIRGVFTGDWERAWSGVKEIFVGIFKGIYAAASIPINGIVTMLNGLIDGANWVIKQLNKISFENPFTGKEIGINIPQIGNIPFFANGGVLSKGSAIVGDAGPELLTMMGNKAIVEPLTKQTTNTTNLGGINMVIYGAPGQDVNELADLVSEKINAQVERKGAAFS